MAVIRQYLNQARTIRALLKEQAGALEREGLTVECSTVHRFQGQERDVVIIYIEHA